jgi:lysophospholipid acyltransferase (LPLAT)-like uncharacterized protein
MTLRSRIEQSKTLAWIVAFVMGNYLWLCQRTTRWTVQGRDRLDADLAQGPVLLVMWHARSMMGPVHWPSDIGSLSSLHDTSPIGRASGRMQKRFGLMPMEMSEDLSNRAASREILRRVKAGISIGMTGDGPEGPVGVVKDAPLDWARVMAGPVYAYAFATRRHRKLGTWDTMMLPLPFTRGAVVFERWDDTLDRNADAQAREDARESLAALMTRAAATADHN